MVDFVSVGQQFVQHYYNTFDTARAVSDIKFKECPIATNLLIYKYSCYSFIYEIVSYCLLLLEHSYHLLFRVWRNCTLTNQCSLSRVSNIKACRPYSTSLVALATFVTISRASMPSPLWTMVSFVSFQVTSSLTAVKILWSSLKCSNSSLGAVLGTSASMTCSDLTTDEPNVKRKWGMWFLKWYSDREAPWLVSEIPS